MGGGLEPLSDSNAEEDHSSYGNLSGQGSRRPQFDAELSGDQAVREAHPWDDSVYVSMATSAWTEEGMDLDELGPFVEDVSELISYPDSDHTQVPEVSRGIFTDKGGVPGPDRTATEVRTVASLVFQLMEICNDSQDLTVVEKVILCEENIFSLCNALSVDSAKVLNGQRMIDFSKLDTLPNVVTGFYGSKEGMMEIFERLGISTENVVWGRMRRDELSPGLYVWLREDSIFVFYWHQGNFLPAASYRGMSCNFVRYLVDLCDTLFVCLEGEKLKDSVFSSVQKFSKNQRTQRLQIALVKASENSISVIPGFSQLPQSLSSGGNAREFKWTVGSRRLALLAAFPQKPKITTSKQTLRMKLDVFPSTVRAWRDNYSLDLSKLPDSDLIIFLQVAQLDHYGEYKKLLASHQTNKDAWSSKKSGIDELKTAEQRMLTSLLHSYVNCCLEIEFPAEHKLFSADQSSTPNPTHDEMPLEVIETDSTGVGFSVARELEDKRKSLTKLESDIYKAIFGNDADRRLVFPGAKCYARDLKSGKHVMFEDERIVFILEHAGQASRSTSHKSHAPFCYDNAAVLRSGSRVYMGKLVSILKVKNSSDVLIVSDDKVGVMLASGMKLQLEFISSTSPGLHMWVKSEAKSSVINHLYRKACFVTSAISTLDEKSKRRCKTDIAEMLLESADVMQQVQIFLGKEGSNFVDLQSIWVGLEGRQIGTNHIAEDVRKLCTTIYQKHHNSVEWKIAGTARQYCEPFLAAKINSQISEEHDMLIATAEKEKKEFLSKVKEGIPGYSGHALKLQVESCKLEKREVGYGRLMLDKFLSSSSENEEVCVIFTQQAKKAESITWKSFEFSPLKDDIDQLTNDPQYVLCPSSCEGKDLIDVDPATQKLLRVDFTVGGQVLVFIEGTKGSELQMFLAPKMGINLSTANPIRILKRGHELFCFDEGTRYIAFYESSIATIKIYRFDDTFRLMDWTGISIQLSEYSVGRLIWMDFVTGKKEIAFIDEQHRLRVCEVSQPAMVKPGNLHIGIRPIIKAMVSTQGSCLLLLRESPAAPTFKVNLVETIHGDVDGTGKCNSGDSETEGTEKESSSGSDEMQGPDNLGGEQALMMDVYRLDDTLALVDSVSLQLTDDPNDLQFAVVCFGSQQHLVYHSRKAPQRIMSKVLKIVSATDICHIQQISRPEDVKELSSASPQGQVGPILDYIPQVFDKYATSPALADEKPRKLHLRLVVRTKNSSSLQTCTFPLAEKCSRYVESSTECLRKEKGKDFTALNIKISSFGVTETSELDALVRDISATEFRLKSPVTMGSWIRRLICLVPIQIARAENNSLQPLIDGLQLSANVNFGDAISLANLIRFGLYETVINPWVGPIKVVSSMGKQSSGKSYLLNHLSGSLLDVAGGRCTDGVWMTVRKCKGCLYILLDFEGLGSFERSEQEDMLLSIFNAAISNVTIFNKKDFHLDKETEAIFQRFQSGVNLVKADSKLFKGLFYMAIKDVDTSDVDDLKKEFFSKISQICSKSKDNFLTQMYGGAVEISAMPFFNRPEFHESIKDIGLTIEEIEAIFSSGKTFLRDVKLIMSQITTKDWSSIDSKRVALRISLLRQHLDTAVSAGCIISDGYQPLIAFDNQTPILDQPLKLEGLGVTVLDTELELTPVKISRDIGDVLQYLTTRFKEGYPRNGVNDDEWHLSLENFISALVERRKRRVLEWLTENTVDFASDGDLQKLKLEVVGRLSEMQQKLLLCSCKCEHCFLKCVQERGHRSNHSCRGDHRCAATCTYCQEETESRMGLTINICGDVAGHNGSHACRGKNHTCCKSCLFAGLSSSCNDICSKKIGHDGDHACNSTQHTCNERCSLLTCGNECVHPVDGGQYDHLHACHERFCPEMCSIQDCNRTCATKDHFHSQKPGVLHHFCGSEHPCMQLCEHQGNCEVLTEVSRKTTTFKGKRCTFDYELVSEQNGKRKGCCLPIPPNKEMHDGPHLHSNDPTVVHFCENKCQSCGYFCTREIGHAGLHRTTHGNMRDVKFAAESEDIDILDRKYSWGESGVAELCNMHCKAQGRGHIHLIPCPKNAASGTVCRKTFDGARHETCKYGPDFNIPKDELTHCAYWEYMRFEDPCDVDERKEFDMCNCRCRSEEHDPPTGSIVSAAVSAQHASYCTEPLWHDAVVRGDVRFGTGYVTDDGHHFSCDHLRNVSSNLIFIIDRSSSMSSSDIQPIMTKFVKNRLGCVYEALTRFIRTRLTQIQEDVVSVVLFHSHAQTVVELELLEEKVVDKLTVHGAAGSTTYSSGLVEAERILKRSAQDVVLASKCPTVIFLSDGGNNGGYDPLFHIRQMKDVDPRLRVHTIMFGNDPAHKILQDMANVGDGSFEASIDEIQLSRRFEALALSLKTKVASLM